MTHMKTMADSDGAFRPVEENFYTCVECRQLTARCQVWESSCGGYEDYKYTCTNPKCRHVRWVDGVDS